MLFLNIYDIKFIIKVADRSDEADLRELLALFLIEHPPEDSIRLVFKKRERIQEIGILLLPYLSKRGIFAMHAGGFLINGKGFLIVGPSGSGKSSFIHIFYKRGKRIISDDLTLLRQIGSDIVLLPLYLLINTRDGIIKLAKEDISSASLRYIIFPQKTENSDALIPVENKKEKLRMLTSQLLWSTEQRAQSRQREILNILLQYPAYRALWSDSIFKDGGVLEMLLKKIN